MINHFYPSLLIGGFLGVDIFFVISGFLITGHINKELTENTFSFTNFYKKRIKRILPALFFMLFIVSLVAIYLLLPEDLNRYSKSLSATLLYISNFYFAFNFDYFAQNTQEFPLLHTWSLSVEEQFYFILPALFYLIYKATQKMSSQLFILTALTLASLALAQYMSASKIYKVFSYYSLPTRFAEMSIGSIFALIYASPSFESKKMFLQKVPLSAYIIFFLAYFLSFSEKTTHPGLATLPILVIAGLYLITDYSRKFESKHLIIISLVWIGTISYSLYLWHWPVLVFYKYAFLHTQHQYLLKVVLILFSILLASLSYYLIENPLRYNNFNFKKSFLLYLILPTILMLAISYYSPNIKRYFSSTSQFQLEEENVFLADTFCYNKKHESCQIGDMKKTPKALLFGDSHAGHYIGIFDQIGKINNFSLTGVSISNCYPLFNLGTNQPSQFKENDIPPFNYVPKCSDIINKLTASLTDYDYILLAGRWSSLLDSEFIKIFPFEDLLVTNLREFEKSGKTVIFLEQVPEFKESSFNYSIRQSLIFGDTSNVFERSYAEVPANQHIKHLIKDYKNIYFFGFTDSSSVNLNKLPYYKDKFIYSDWNHLKESGGRHLATDLAPLFKDRFNFSEK